jgi:aryl-alcohol dehydrogenase-like predicted oxidoreductase
MCLSHTYGELPSRERAERLLRHALDIVVDFADTATLYGFGANETLIGALRDRHLKLRHHPVHAASPQSRRARAWIVRGMEQRRTSATPAAK